MKKIILSLGLIAVCLLANATLSVLPTSVTLNSSGGNDTLIVTSSGAWTAVADSSWMNIVSGNSGSGNGIIVYSMATNNRISNGARYAHITVTPSSGTAIVVTVIQKTSFTPKGLHGTYIKINSYVGISIPVKEGNLGAKTSPTVFYWMEVDTMVHMNIRQMDSQGFVTFTNTFRLYYDYQSYWMWKPPFDCMFSTMYTTPWEDVSDGSDFNLCNNYDALLIAYISQTLNIPLNQLFIYAY